jgi:oligopeptide/dipeptide ABC transporter ATP-binding protein
MALLEVKDLRVTYRTTQGEAQAVDSVSFSLQAGENLGLVGESGCGKTTAAKALLRLLPPNGEITKGEIWFQGRDLVPLPEEELKHVRWKAISMISQSAMNALDPVYRVGDQLVEAIRTHENVTKATARERAGQLFEIVGLERKRLRDYPHQLSGGMRQRSIIAMALALNPMLIIADEPTTALDVIVQDQILQKIKELRQEWGSAMIFITHDISVIAETCDTVAVMYAGKVMEYASTRRIFKQAYHPYTLGLQNAFPSIDVHQPQLISIPGFPPSLIQPPQGCRFRPRCPFATEQCHQEPPLVEVDPGHQVACHYTDKVDVFRQLARREETWQQVSERIIA